MSSRKLCFGGSVAHSSVLAKVFPTANCSCHLAYAVIPTSKYASPLYSMQIVVYMNNTQITRFVFVLSRKLVKLCNFQSQLCL